MVEINSAYVQAKNAYDKRIAEIDDIKNKFKNTYSDYSNDTESMKNKVTIFTISAVLLAILSPFISYLLVSLADIDDVIESPIYIILFSVSFLSVACYVALHAAKNKIILDRKNSINEYIIQLDSLKDNLKHNLNKNSYTANLIDIDTEISKLKEISNTINYEDNDILNGTYRKEVYWISTVVMMTATAALADRIILGALLQEYSGWLAFCSILYFVASGAVLWALYHFWFNKFDFMYTTGSYIFNLFFQLLFTILLLILWPVVLIAIAIGIIIAFFYIIGG